jgi:hypothetical protein
MIQEKVIELEAQKYLQNQEDLEDFWIQLEEDLKILEKKLM